MTQQQSPSSSTRHPHHFTDVLTILFLPLILTACSPFTAQIKPDETLKVPAQYAIKTENTESLPTIQWWTNFASEDLNRLVQKALAGNLSLKQTWARMEQARASTNKSRSKRFPDLDFTTEQSLSRSRENDATANRDSSSLGLSSSFEVDLWGRISAEINSQKKEYEATREDLGAAAISLSAEVSDRWLQLVQQIEQQQLLDEQIQTAQSYLNLIDLRFRKSQATALDLLQQKESIAALKTKRPELQAQEQRLRYELALLIGQNPRYQLDLSSPELPQLPPLPQLGIPAQLLEQRPDIRAAAFGCNLRIGTYLLRGPTGCPH